VHAGREETEGSGLDAAASSRTVTGSNEPSAGEAEGVPAYGDGASQASGAASAGPGSGVAPTHLERSPSTEAPAEAVIGVEKGVSGGGGDLLVSTLSSKQAAESAGLGGGGGAGDREARLARMVEQLKRRLEQYKGENEQLEELLATADAQAKGVWD
jgi:hypothetical protein